MFCKKVAAIGAGVLLFVGGAMAQHNHNHTHGRTCYAHTKLQEEFQQNPAREQSMRDIEAMTQQYIQEHGHARNGQTRTIPVYIHVIYNSSQENISDAQIQSQITQLNADYAATNSDYNPPSDFASVASGNTGIQFTIAGITRKQSSKSSWGTNDNMKRSSQGGVDPVTPATHLNMWVCNIGGGILGYAQFPGGSASTDGVVMSPQYFGSANYGSGYYLSAPFNKGRTTTHEVGHYLNLRHIWGDGGCSVDDFVDDTPVAGSANYGCPNSSTNSCSGGQRDMFMNYMDYVDDNCMFMFSQGQTARMWATLNGSRSQLGTSSNTGGGGNTGGGSTACNDNEVTLNLDFDNYASETTWSLKNSAGATLYSGSGYADGNDKITETFCLPDGCYDFVINDSYGDGICCSYGNGSYSLVSGGNSLASGASFTSSETKQICVGSNGGGGNTGGGGGGTPAGTTQIFGDYFESGFGNWNDGGSDCARYSGSRSYEGNYSIRIRDNSGTGSAMTSDAFDASGYDQVKIDLVFYPYGMETGEDFWIRFYNGSSWQTVATYASGTNFNNNTFYTATVTLNKADYNFSSGAKFRIQCDASANADQVYIDQVVVTGINGNARTEGSSITSLGAPVNTDTESSLEFETAMELNLYPNPATTVLNVELLNETTCIGRIIDATGKQLWTAEIEAGANVISLDQLPAGMYYFSAVQADGNVVTKKFLKQ